MNAYYATWKWNAQRNSNFVLIFCKQIKLSDLNLEGHARDKFLRLVGPRYNIPSDLFTLVTDCCPMRKQNFDYALYLLAALYHESRVSDSVL